MIRKSVAVAAAVGFVAVGASQQAQASLFYNNFAKTAVETITYPTPQTTELTGLSGTRPEILTLDQANSGYFAGYSLSGITLVFSGTLSNTGSLQNINSSGVITGFGFSQATFSFTAANGSLNAALATLNPPFGFVETLNTNVVTVSAGGSAPVSGGPSSFNSNPLSLSSSLFSLFEYSAGTGVVIPGNTVDLGGNTHTLASASQTGGGGTISFSLTTQAYTAVAISYQYAAIQTPIPEPVSAVLLGSGLLGLGALRMRRRKI